MQIKFYIFLFELNTLCSTIMKMEKRTLIYFEENPDFNNVEQLKRIYGKKNLNERKLRKQN